MDTFSLNGHLKRPRNFIHFPDDLTLSFDTCHIMTDKPKYVRMLVVIVVYLSLFLDNVLLTVVVPIIPDYLCNISNNSTDDDEENERVGLLLSSKALIQLILNPVVGIFTGKIGYAKPLLLGNLSLIFAALIFAFGKTYELLFMARSIQGVSSACIGVSGMSLVASQYPDEGERSKIMGFVLGSIALGVLVGYPIGSILYDIEGKEAPFLLITLFILLPICLQIFILNSELNSITCEKSSYTTNWRTLLTQGNIVIISGAILSSTIPMAILEPCLPIWLRSHIKPKKWQLGIVFIPDSIGYLIGTNFFGIIAFRYGRCKIAVFAMTLIGISIIILPSATTMSQLVFPHLGMGLGIGIADAALVPLLASLVDQDGNYGPIYSIQQVAVSLAYSLGPIVGSELVRAIGFQWLMRSVGLINLLYCPFLVYLAKTRQKRLLNTENDDQNKQYYSIKTGLQYDRFYDSDDDL